MNCDLAFDLLTDPQGCRSSALEAHLAGCPRCRQMRDTLSPAMNWLAEAAEDAAASGAGSSMAYSESAPAALRPIVTAETLEIARQAAAVLAARRASPIMRLQRYASVGLGYAAVLFAGALVTMAIILPGSDSSGPDRSECTRRQYAGPTAGRSLQEARLIVATCAVCHLPAERAPAAPETEQGRLDIRLPLGDAEDEPMVCAEPLGLPARRASEGETLAS